MVVRQQPAVTVITSRIVGDNYFTLSIILTVVCFFFGFYTLLCTIPAIFFAANVSLLLIWTNVLHCVLCTLLLLYILKLFVCIEYRVDLLYMQFYMYNGFAVSSICVYIL